MSRWDLLSFLGGFSEITFVEVLNRSFVRCGFFYSKVESFWSRTKKKIKFFDHRKLEKNDFEISRCFHVEILNFMILYFSFQCSNFIESGKFVWINSISSKQLIEHYKKWDWCVFDIFLRMWCDFLFVFYEILEKINPIFISSLYFAQI
jgi:hypothetical protein